jgi:hypothetical protein
VTILSVSEVMALLAGRRGEELARRYQQVARHYVAYQTQPGDEERTITTPITLRDVRRGAYRSANVGSGGNGWLVVSVAAPALVALGARLRSSPWENKEEIDRLISRFGADYRIDHLIDAIEDTAAGREIADRQDHHADTDRVVDDPLGCDDAAAHGGDGNSGELDHRAETSAQSERDTPDGTSEDAGAGTDCTAGDQTGTDDASTREIEEMPTCQGEMGGDEPTREMGTHLTASQADTDTDSDGTESSAQGDGTERVQDPRAAKAQAHGAPCTQAHPWTGDMGVVTDDDVADGDAESPGATLVSPAVLAARERRAARRTAELLRRIIHEEIGAKGRETPHVDARTLVRELVSRRCAIDRARRHEADIRELVLAVDESPSCSQVVAALYATALAIARDLPAGKASVILHSNGYSVRIRDDAPCGRWLRSAIAERSRRLSRHYYAASQREASEEIWRVIAKRRPGLVLALGDHDADWALEILRDGGAHLLAVHHHEVAPMHSGIRRLGPVTDAMSAAAVLERFTRGEKH